MRRPLGPPEEGPHASVSPQRPPCRLVHRGMFNARFALSCRTTPPSIPGAHPAASGAAGISRHWRPRVIMMGPQIAINSLAACRTRHLRDDEPMFAPRHRATTHRATYQGQGSVGRVGGDLRALAARPCIRTCTVRCAATYLTLLLSWRRGSVTPRIDAAHADPRAHAPPKFGAARRGVTGQLATGCVPSADGGNSCSARPRPWTATVPRHLGRAVLRDTRTGPHQ